MLLLSPPLHIRLDDEDPVLSLSDAFKGLLLEQLLHLTVLDEISILLPFLTLLLCESSLLTTAGGVSSLQPAGREEQSSRLYLQYGSSSQPVGAEWSCVGPPAAGCSCSLTAQCVGSLQQGQPRVEPSQSRHGATGPGLTGVQVNLTVTLVPVDILKTQARGHRVSLLTFLASLLRDY